MQDLFSETRPHKQQIAPDIWLLSNFVDTKPLLSLVDTITQSSPFRKMLTPNGHYTGVAATNCGKFGWVSDKTGYRYSPIDPINKNQWPALPSTFEQLAKDAAKSADFENFCPDACLINRYLIGTKLGSHQDKNEVNFKQPIVSVSIGLPAIFQIFGSQRSGKAINVQLYDGDVMVWGNSSRLIYHGVKALTENSLDPNQKQRINLTFRKSH
jgi:alkylated DNA repair protein (DNA oxidative demethylase)